MEPQAEIGGRVTLQEAAASLGVSPNALTTRIERGDLAEAFEVGDTWMLPAADLPLIADREGWVIDLTSDSAPNLELDALLERLLTINSDLVESETGRKLAEATVTRQADELRDAHTTINELESVIEEQHSENGRLAVDLADALADVRVAEAVATERMTQINELQVMSANERDRANEEIAVHRAQTLELRGRLEESLANMGWLTRRRYSKSRK